MVCIMQFTSLFYNTSFFYGKNYRETVVLSRWEGITGSFRHSEASGSPLLWRRANARNVGVETLYGGQFTLSTQLVILTYPVVL